MTEAKARFTEILGQLEEATPFQAAKLARELEKAASAMPRSDALIRELSEPAALLSERVEEMSRLWSDQMSAGLSQALEQFELREAEVVDFLSVFERTLEEGQRRLALSVKETLGVVETTPLDELLEAQRLLTEQIARLYQTKEDTQETQPELEREDEP